MSLRKDDELLKFPESINISRCLVSAGSFVLCSCSCVMYARGGVLLLIDVVNKWFNCVHIWWSCVGQCLSLSLSLPLSLLVTVTVALWDTVQLFAVKCALVTVP